MTFKQYRILDIAIFTVIASVLEAAAVYMFNIFKLQIFTLSFTFVLGFIAVYRWNAYGLATAVISSLVGVLTRQALQQEVTILLFLSYSLSYIGIGLELLFFHFRKFDKESIRKDIPYLSFAYFSSYLVVELLKALFQIGSESFYKIAILYFSYDLLNIIFNYIVLLIARAQRNLLVDMKEYVIKVNTPLNEVKEIRTNTDYLKLESLCDNDQLNDQALLDGGTLTTNDLKQLEDDRRRFEGTTSVFDEENKAIQAYSKEKSKKGDS